MIYVTGDLHGMVDLHKLSTSMFPEQKEMRKKDYVIVCGDFGLVWCGDEEEKNGLRWLEEKNFTTLFVDGNHENHTMLGRLPVTDFCGGRAHQVSETVYHLMRGEVFEICGKTVFAMGGAESHDKEYRKKDVSWWPAELPTDDEYQNAMKNLDAHGWRVDYIVTHCCADSIQDKVALYPIYPHNKLTAFFEETVNKKCSFEKWFFGHYHVSESIDEKYICLFERMYRVL